MQTNFNIAPAPLEQLATGEDYSRPLVLVASAAAVLAVLSACGESTAPTYNNTNLASAPHDAPANLRAGTVVVFEEFETKECTPAKKAAAGSFAGMVVHIAPTPKPKPTPTKSSPKPSPSPRPSLCEDSEVQVEACQDGFIPDSNPEKTADNCAHLDATGPAFEAATGLRLGEIADNQPITLENPLSVTVDRD